MHFTPYFPRLAEVLRPIGRDGSRASGRQFAVRIGRVVRWLLRSLVAARRGAGTIYSLQEFRGPPFDLLVDLSGVVIPLQAGFALGAVGFGMAAWSRFREPFAY